MASWYGPGFAGRKTASGEIYDPRKLTAAHPTLPLGIRVRVTVLDTGRSVTVRVNDRGPFVEGRVLDLSRAAAEVLGLIERGVARVEIAIDDSRYNGWPLTRYAVQAGAFRSRREAYQLARDMVTRGYSVYLVRSGEQKPIYRVRLGPYDTRRRAETVAAGLRAAEIRSMIIEEPPAQSWSRLEASSHSR